MADVGDWLDSLELGEFAEAFAANGVDRELLGELSNEDLKDLGVARLADRKRLLKAIAELQHSPADAAARRPHGAERRHLTVMFCDLVGSTELSGRLDPEDLRDVMRTYQNTVAGEIARFEGHLAKFMGDGVIAYFGYPRAHEDDAERALRAGLAVARAVPGLQRADTPPLQVRIGIATGQVVVGDLIGDGAAQEEAVTGETPNLAARLQELAAPNAVVISAATRALTGNTFECSDLGARTLKGIGDPVRVWRVDEERQLESRFEARAARLTAFVGREHEVGLLAERWQQAKLGDGQVVMLSGEAGIGKSRILEALREQFAAEAHTRLHYQCSPFHVNSALYPVITQLERAAGFSIDDAADARFDKLEALLAASFEDLGQAMPLLAALLSLPLGAGYAALEFSPQLQKSRTLDVLCDQLSALARRQPVLLLFEDAHWIDPTTLELLQRVIERVAAERVMALITHRPEFEAPWPLDAHVTALALNRLAADQCAEIIRDLSREQPLPEQVLEQIAAKTDGVPLFVEELTKSVLESDLLARDDAGSEAAGPLPAMAIPGTLQDSLMARLDRLAEVKELAQIGAAIGREFPHRLLAAVSALRAAELGAGVEQLVASGLVFRRGEGEAAIYIFKHALVQDVAYESLLRSRRQTLHRDIAKALEKVSADTIEVEAEVLAHHYTLAGESAQAMVYWQQAGERALRRSANIEAINHLNQALALLETLPESDERGRRELSLQLVLGQALMAVRGQGAPEVRQAYGRARELGQQVGETRQHFQALWGSWRIHVVQSDHEAGRDLAKQCLSLAEQSGDDALRLEAHFALGGSLVLMGEFAAARQQLDEAVPLYDIDRHAGLAFQFGQDPGASNLAYLGWALWFLGFPEQSWEQGRKALALAETLGHPFTLAQVSMYLAMTHALGRDWPAVRTQAEATMAISEAHGFPQNLWFGTAMHGRALVAAGQVDVGLARIEEGVAAREATGVRGGRLLELALLADAYGIAGRVEAGLRVLHQALAFAERTGEGFGLPELHRLKGVLLLQQDMPGAMAAAESCFLAGLEVARRQQARILELRSATSLARLMRQQGQSTAARDLLGPLYGWFTEGFDTPDLGAAKDLLDALS